MSANPNFDEIVTTTLKRRSGKVADNVMNNNALLMWLKKSGNTKLEPGGETLVQELSYAENSTFKYFSGYDVLDMSASDVISAAEFDWKQANVNVVMSGLEMNKNAISPERVIDLISARIKNAEATFANNIATGIYSDGTGSGGRQIGGLQLLVADDPTTGTVGGIDRSSFTFWQNKKFAGVADGGVAVSAANIQDYMNRLHVQLIRGMDMPKVIPADPNYYTFYENALQQFQRITQAESGDSGYQTLMYKGIPVMLDHAAPANHMYFLNTDYLFWRVHKNANFSVQESIRPFNQDAIGKSMLFMGNLTISNSELQGTLIA